MPGIMYGKMMVVDNNLLQESLHNRYEQYERSLVCINFSVVVGFLHDKSSIDCITQEVEFINESNLEPTGIKKELLLDRISNVG